ncbi:hypothetical protein [Streptomyces pseudogriseolus]|uniref:hypothetical protein n=1 Tax=Streptomyces pseudogriseolus TaxID=36817 RepID=UPI0027DFDDF4|nr:hypothetical protein [Streptomyces pseudogriseolus]
MTARGSADRCQVHLASSLHGTGGGVEELATIYPGIAEDVNMHVVPANHVGPAGPWTGCGRSSVWAPRRSSDGGRHADSGARRGRRRVSFVRLMLGTM